MKNSLLRARYRRIMLFFAGVAINFIFWEVVLPRIGLRGLARRTRSNRYRNVAAQFRSPGDPDGRGDDQGGPVPVGAPGCPAG